VSGRGWITWLVFAVGALLVVEVMAWATWRVLALERSERRASIEADAAQRERLALWQMDSIVSALIARESTRPYFEYRPRYAADLPYDRAWDLDHAGAVARSPLASGSGDPIVRLYYQVESDGRVTSPQVDPDDGLGHDDPDSMRAGRLMRELSRYDDLALARHPDRAIATPKSVGARAEDLGDETPADHASPVAEGDEDVALRQQLFDLARAGRSPRDGQALPASVEVGIFQPRWLLDPASGEQLVFERTVVLAGVPHRQGLWVDWPALRAELLAVAVRLLPLARLEPATEPGGTGGSGGGGPGGRMLATIPLRLETPAEPVVLAAFTPIRVTLAATWAAAICALAGIGLVLRAATQLARRRGRFVAAVSHELRSPLTSFRLTTDLLARSEDPDRRREQIERLRLEAGRLSAVVENVLAYAGMERSESIPAPRPLGTAFEGLLPALRDRAVQSRAELEVEIDDAALEARIRVRPGSLERILMNLVDNACRYGLTEDRRRIRLSGDRDGVSLRLRVRDEGPGIPPAERERIFRDFFRGASARSVPSGMGLGLALARGLARAEGGDLRLLRAPGPGASFELILPIAGARDG
jgi:signal transduction histidine kinase